MSHKLIDRFLIFMSVSFFERSTEKIDLEIIDAGAKSILDFGEDDLMPHFIYCGNYYIWEKGWEKFETMFSTKMKKYGIQSAVLTGFWIARNYLIPKEKQKMAYEGKLKNDEDWKYYNGSMNDDLESFFENLQLKKEVELEWARSFFLPKLTNDELKLVEEKNLENLKSYSNFVYGMNPDVDIEEMKKSKSKSKFIHCNCYRLTIPLKLKSNQTSAAESEVSSSQTSLNDGSEDSSESESEAGSSQSPSEALSEALVTLKELVQKYLELLKRFTEIQVDYDRRRCNRRRGNRRRF